MRMVCLYLEDLEVCVFLASFPGTTQLSFTCSMWGGSGIRLVFSSLLMLSVLRLNIVQLFYWTKQRVWSVNLYSAHALEGNTWLWPWPLQQSYFLISLSTQVNFQAKPQVYMEEVYQLNQETVLRSKVLLQRSVNVHAMKTLWQLYQVWSRSQYNLTLSLLSSRWGSASPLFSHSCIIHPWHLHM